MAPVGAAVDRASSVCVGKAVTAGSMAVVVVVAAGSPGAAIAAAAGMVAAATSKVNVAPANMVRRLMRSVLMRP